jgi:hypothetical protein
MNSPYKDNVARDITFADWSDDKRYHPATIDFEHLRKFKNDGTEFVNDVYGKGQIIFIRKLPDNSEKLLEFIRKEIWQNDGLSPELSGLLS